jgi:hypothetical protein
MLQGSGFVFLSAERAGFEPAIPFQVYTLSRRAPSTTRTPLLQLFRVNLLRSANMGAQINQEFTPEARRPELYTDISPASDLEISSRHFSGPNSPSNNISLVIAASVVRSAPPITPISRRFLLVSYRPCVTVPP